MRRWILEQRAHGNPTTSEEIIVVAKCGLGVVAIRNVLHSYTHSMLCIGRSRLEYRV